MKKPVKRTKKKPVKRTKKKPVKQQAIVKVEPKVEQLAVAPNIAETVHRIEQVRRFITQGLNQGLQRALKKNLKLPDYQRRKLEIDYGTIPGVPKKFLLQPGAEKICLWLRVRPKYETTSTELPGGHVEVVSRCRLMASKDGAELFEGPACSCSSMESNFRFRWVKRDTKELAAPTKEEGARLKAAGVGKWVAEKDKKSGSITGWMWFDRYDNPNIADERNKVRQMSEKRALVKAVRNFGAMSEIFTEDPSEWSFPDEDGIHAPEEEPTGRIVKEEAQSAAKPSQKQQEPAQQGNKPLIQIIWKRTGENLESATLAGDFLQMKVWLERECFAVYLKNADCWCIPDEQVHVLADECERLGYDFQEVQMSSGQPSTAAEGQRSAPKAQPKAQESTGEQEKAAQVSSGPVSLVGTIQSVQERKTQNKKVPYLLVGFKQIDVQNGAYFHLYEEKWWDFTRQAHQKKVECAIVTEGHVLARFDRIGLRKFEEDGTMIRSREEIGNATLFPNEL